MITYQNITLKNWSQCHTEYDHKKGYSFDTVERQFIAGLDIDGAQPQLYLFDRETTERHSPFAKTMPPNAAFFFQQALDKIAPELSLCDVKCLYMDSEQAGEFEFHASHGQVSKIQYKTANYCYHENYLDNLEKALNSPNNFIKETIQTSPHNQNGEGIVVPAPKHPLQYIFKRRCFDVPHMIDDFEVVLVDSQKFMTFWRLQAEGKTPFCNAGSHKEHFDAARNKNDDDIRLIDSSLELSIHHTIPQTDAQHETAYLGFMMGSIGFCNGRHRTANLANLGAPFIPITISKKDDLAGFKKTFEWTGNSKAQKDNNITFEAI